MEFVLVPGGSFQMGSNDGDSEEKPVHQVTVRPFLISKYEVTQAVWEKIMGQAPSNFKGDGNLPVERVSWDMCQTFCQKAGLQLPSEAQWEYACRAGTTTKYSWGNDMDGEYCWHDGNSGSMPHPVGIRKPNAFGLYDMSGNVGEWCQDGWHDNYQGAPSDGSVWETEASASKRVCRGGSWRNRADYGRCANRCAFRVRDALVFWNYDLGFRLCRPV
jgi:formylglycine-generating enzyme required for sulfatase activity